MEPTTGMFLLMGAQAGLTGAGLAASRQQQKIDKAKISAEAEVAKERNAQASLNAAREFRRSLSSQLAIASLRSRGGGSIMRQFGAEAMGTMYRDEAEFGRRERFLGLQEKFGRTQASSARFQRDISGIGQLMQSGMNMVNFSGSPTTDLKGGGKS